MSKNLLIVESPSKARTIKKFVGPDFRVLASVGHIRDLPVKELGVDIEKNFKPHYVTISGKGKIIKELCAAAKDAEHIFLAPDPDREGEAIAWHIAALLKVDDEQIRRVLFTEITRSGIQSGLARPRQIDLSLVNAQQARRILDRIVGYQVSPFLWKTLYRGLSAGRVQTVAVRIICEREEEIENFRPREYWELFADLKTAAAEKFTAKCLQYKKHKLTIADGETAATHRQALEQASYRVTKIAEKELKKSPSPPFTTSTLQQESTRRFRLAPARTMRIAQQLYEGIDVEGTPVGLITYMRTDSVRIAGEAMHGIRQFIETRYGKDYLAPKPRYFQTKKKNIQDAHEAIRPTRFDLPPEQLEKQLSREQFKLYRLIWNRFAASQMASARYLQKSIDITAGDYLFRVSGQTPVFDGFQRLTNDGREKESKPDGLPVKIAEQDTLELEKLRADQKFTEPPPRLSEGTLIKELDRLGIGRPSTYASIVSTIIDRKYIEKVKGSLQPTELGKVTNRILVNGMPEIFNVQFTSVMEEDLDNIEANRKDWLEVLREFYTPFKKSLDHLNEKRQTIKESVQEKTEHKCDLCGAPMLIKWSKNGRFLACSAFPKCKNTRPLEAPEVELREDKSCPECGSPMVLKEGRFGKFWACSTYPKCRGTLPFTLDINCPEADCDGQIVEKRTRKGKTFYGCSNYPKCKFATWNEPIGRSCPACGHPILERRIRKSQANALVCPGCKAEFPEEEEQKSR